MLAVPRPSLASRPVARPPVLALRVRPEFLLPHVWPEWLGTSLPHPAAIVHPPLMSFIARIHMEARGAVQLGTPRTGVELNGGVLVDNDYPVLGGRVRLAFHGESFAVPLPSIQVAPTMVNGALGF